jgi:hypothetical protein
MTRVTQPSGARWVQAGVSAQNQPHLSEWMPPSPQTMGHILPNPPGHTMVLLLPGVFLKPLSTPGLAGPQSQAVQP